MTDLALDLEEMRCAMWSRAASVDPIGTVGSHQGYLLADVDLPWPRDLGRLPAVAAVQAVLAGTGIRFQATVPVGARRVVLYRRDADSGRGPDLQRRQVVLGTAAAPDLVGAAELLLAGGGEATDGPRREVLVCTHGNRDVCCGAQGTRLHLELAGADRPLGADVEVRRTSHTGGHRFAPTAVVLPEGTGWAYLDVDTLRAVVERRGPVADVLARYRGWSGLASPRLQALDRAVLAEVGWDLLDRSRRGETDGDVARLEIDEPGGGTSRWSAEVVAGRRIPRPDCGQAAATATKADVELVVRTLRQEL